MPPDDVLREPHLTELLRQIDPIRDHARQIAGSMTTEQLRWRYAPRTWSVAECLEHLIVCGELYHDRLEPLLDRAEKLDGPEPWRSSFMGRLLIKSVTTSRRLKGPGAFKPPHQPRENVLGQFLASIDRLERLIRKSDGVDLTKTRLSSPASRLIRLNAGDCLTMLVLHAKRHLRQAARVAESRRMPRTN